MGRIVALLLALLVIFFAGYATGWREGRASIGPPAGAAPLQIDRGDYARSDHIRRY